ncbi:Peroxisomal membrane protein PEX16 [Dufourea novaeangliae]|uniref:Peroxisomal membrane protein PEX16 n=1 Tax=Dufourea novaeangliae TaxID=178035 RepID=A0A154PAE2_DUFNO|nr:Peroxisomal membrane protein PEX16 [Dufourea novaeangliae]
MVFDKLNTSVLKIIEPYRKWAIENPKLLTDLEETVQCLSYFTAGRFNNSTLTSELIYSLSNLIVLCNDLLMCSGKCLHLKFPQFKSKIKIWLTVVEYTETLFEISAKKIWGPSGRWFIVIVIQVFKTVLRLLLIHVYKEKVIKSPPLKPLNRNQLNESDEEKLKEGFTLKRSGTVVRSVRGSNSTHMRTWEPLSSNVKDNLNSSPVSERNIALAESLYVMKPLFHLGCISLTGEKQWPPWLLSLAIDLFSLKIFNKEVKKAVSLSKEDERELYKRRLALLLYILRSPFYDRCSRTRIYAILTALSNNVPLAKFIAEPIKRYLPHWQSTYFYVWSS